MEEGRNSTTAAAPIALAQAGVGVASKLDSSLQHFKHTASPSPIYSLSSRPSSIAIGFGSREANASDLLRGLSDPWAQTQTTSIESSLGTESMSGTIKISPKDVANAIQGLNASFDEQLQIAINIGQRVIALGKIGASDIAMIPEVQELMGLPQRVPHTTTTASHMQLPELHTHHPEEQGASPIAGPSSESIPSKLWCPSVNDPSRFPRAFGNIFTKTTEEIEKELAGPTLEPKERPQNEPQSEREEYKPEATNTDAGGEPEVVCHLECQWEPQPEESYNTQMPAVVDAGVERIIEKVDIPVPENVDQSWPWEERQGSSKEPWGLNMHDERIFQSSNVHMQGNTADLGESNDTVSAAFQPVVAATQNKDSSENHATFMAGRHQDNVLSPDTNHINAAPGGGAAWAETPEDRIHGLAVWQGMASQVSPDNTGGWAFDNRKGRRRTFQNPKRGRGGYMNMVDVQQSDYTNKKQYYNKGKENIWNAPRGQPVTNRTREQSYNKRYSNWGDRQSMARDSEQVNTTTYEQSTNGYSHSNLQSAPNTTYIMDETLADDTTHLKSGEVCQRKPVVLLPWKPTRYDSSEAWADLSTTAGRLGNPKVELPVPSAPGPRWMFSQTKNILEIE